MDQNFNDREDSISIDESSMVIERRKFYRYVIPDQFTEKYSAIFKLPQNIELKQRINNLNTEAVAINVEKENWEYLEDQTEFTVNLQMDTDLIESCSATLIRSSSNVIVLSLKGISSKKREVIRSHFPVLLGYSLKSMETHPTSPKFPAVWYHGDNNTDIFLWKPSSESPQFNKCVFSFEDQIIEWDADRGLKTVKVEREAFLQTLDFTNREEPVKEYDTKPNVVTVDYALRIIKSSPVVEVSHKTFLINLLETSGGAK